MGNGKSSLSTEPLFNRTGDAFCIGSLSSLRANFEPDKSSENDSGEVLWLSNVIRNT